MRDVFSPGYDRPMNQPGYPRPSSNKGLLIGLAIGAAVILFLGVLGIMCVVVGAKRSRALAIEDAGLLHVDAGPPGEPTSVGRSGPAACEWGTAAGMPPSLRWGKHGAADEASCMSKPLTLLGGEIRYFARGRDLDSVDQVSLVLDVRGVASSELAQKNLASAFETIARQAHQKPVPLSVDDTIRKGEEDISRVAGYRCAMKKTPYVNGVGYEYRIDLNIN